MKKLLLTTAMTAVLAIGTHAAFAADPSEEAPTVTTHHDAVEGAKSPLGPGTIDPNESPQAAPAVSIPKGTLYTPSGSDKKMTFGQLVGRHIKSSNLSDFKAALEKSEVSNYDPSKGYTVFAPVNGKFDAAKHPVDAYIVNGHFAFDVMKGTNDTVTSMHGDKLRVSKVGESYYVNNMLVNSADSHSDGLIYTVGGSKGVYRP